MQHLINTKVLGVGSVISSVILGIKCTSLHKSQRSGLPGVSSFNVVQGQEQLTNHALLLLLLPYETSSVWFGFC